MPEVIAGGGARDGSMAETDLYLSCIRCGRPASAGPEGAGEHHDPPKGMGGTSLPQLHASTPLCRKCHNDLHAKRFVIRVDGPIAYCVDPKTGEVLSVRALSPRVLEGDYGPADVDIEVLAGLLPQLDDESLAHLWDCGARWEEQGVVFEALAAKGFRDHYGSYGEEWYIRAADVIREVTGRPMAPATVYDRDSTATALEASGWRLEVLGNLGRYVLAEVGKAENPVQALELAGEMRDAREPARHIVKELKRGRPRRKLRALEDSEPEPPADRVWARCPDCGRVGWMERLPAPEECVLAEARAVVEEATGGD